MYTFLPLVAVLALLLAAMFKILAEYERAVVFRLGRVIGAKGPGLIIIIPLIDRFERVSLRTVTLDVPSQDVITKDNVSVKVSAVIYFRVIDAVRAIVEVEDFLFATSQLAQTTLRSVCGSVELDGLLTHRDEVNARIQTILDEQTGPWGIKVSNVEVKHIDLPQDMQRAMARQAEAERERRAKVIRAEGEYQAADRLAQAADILNMHPAALQLRYMQTLSEITGEGKTSTIVPLPIGDIFGLMSPGKGGK